MKAMKAMKAMRAMKAMKSMKIARGRFAKALVLRGTREKTSGGLKKEELFMNKRGKVVSKKASAKGKQNFQNIKGWSAAVAKARADLHLTGFIAVGGKTPAGKALYAKARALYTA